ncbi:hypothetical protein AB0M83_11835 [Amycolatopsis sp. NPDC051106]|uniref:hypothetical protein n=1 Tax=unclassified Amycolatopsis TaxID=2618356 RepID=UPI0034272AB5
MESGRHRIAWRVVVAVAVLVFLFFGTGTTSLLLNRTYVFAGGDFLVAAAILTGSLGLAVFAAYRLGSPGPPACAGSPATRRRWCWPGPC